MIIDSNINGRQVPGPRLFNYYSLRLIALQIFYLEDEEINVDPITIKTNYSDFVALFKEKRVLIASLAICISTSTLAILEVCVPIWLLGKCDPPPSKWQLGAVFIPDSFGYFIGSHFAG